jgi:sec-independent protein translocase protein TatB
MFEIDFFKLIIVAMIGLLVLGPEKLPSLAAKLGRWMGRARSMARQFRMQLEQEVLLEEARQQNKQTIHPPSAPATPAQSNPPAESHVATSHTPEGVDGHNPSEVTSGAPVATAQGADQTSQAVRTHD